MTAALNRSGAPSQLQVCIACFTALGSAEKSVPGVRGHKEGPLHEHCAISAERRLAAQRQANGNSASTQQTQT